MNCALTDEYNGGSPRARVSCRLARTGVAFRGAVLVAAVVTSDACSRTNASLAPAPSAAPAITSDPASEFRRAAIVERVLQLESTPNSRIGQISRYRRDEASGHIFIGDTESSSPHLYEFTGEGRLVRRFGTHGTGVGEYEYLQDFAVNRNIVALFSDYKMLIYDRLGKFLGEKTLDYIPSTVVVAPDGSFHADALRVQLWARDRRHAVVHYTAAGIETARSVPYDTRVDKYTYASLTSLAMQDGRLYVTEPFAPTISEVTVSGDVTKRITFPFDAQAAASPLWQLPKLTRPQQRELRYAMHRFTTILSTGRGLALFEQNERSDTFAFSLFSPSANTTIRYPDLRLTSYDSRVPKAQVPLERLAGGYENGVVGAISDDNAIAKLIKTDPAFKNVTYSLGSNPLLVFVAFRSTASIASRR